MSFSEIQREALKLPAREKADLVCKLPEALPSNDIDLRAAGNLKKMASNPCE